MQQGQYVGRNPFLSRLNAATTPGGYAATPQPQSTQMSPPIPSINARANDLSIKSSFMKNLMRLRTKDPNATDDDIFNQLAPNVLSNVHTQADDHASAVDYLRRLVGTTPDGRTLPIPSAPPPAGQGQQAPQQQAQPAQAQTPMQRDGMTDTQRLLKYYPGLAGQVGAYGSGQ